jgi:hypothetical protein
MNGYNFTDQVRTVIALGREVAASLGHDYVGTEHILLALMRESNIATTIVANLGVEPSVLCAAVLGTVDRGAEVRSPGDDLRYTSSAKSVLELAMREARELGHKYVGTEHLLLGILREGRDTAALVLMRHGIKLARARDEVRHVLGIAQDDATVGTPGDASLTPRKMQDPWRILPEPVQSIVANAFRIATDRGERRPSEADLLTALLLSSRETAAALAARGVDVHALIAEIRDLTDPR